MPLVEALIVLVVLLVVTIAVGAILRLRQGRPQRPLSSDIVEPERLGASELGRDATLLQFSTQLCARCPSVHRTLAGIADASDGVLHLDVDLTDRPDIAKHFSVFQTPTTLILDRDGAIQTRFGGTVSRQAVELELARVVATDARV